MATHEALRLLVSGSLVAVQPAIGSGGKVETLSVDMASGDVRLTQQPALSGGSEPVLALIGAFRLRAATVVAVVTGAQKVGCVGGGLQARGAWGGCGGRGDCGGCGGCHSAPRR